jgi:uroporphyrinogen decarboxylase
MILDELGVDFRRMGMGSSDDFRARASLTSHGWRVVHPDGSLEDEWGVRVKYDEQERYYRFVYHPLADEAALSSYSFPDLKASGRFGRKPLGTDKPEYARLALRNNLFKTCWQIRGFDRFLMDLLINQDFAEELLDRLLIWQLEVVRRQASVGVDILGAVGDIAWQRGMFMSLQTWRKYFKQREAALIEEGRRHGVAHFFTHSDGNIMQALDDLVEIGFDVIDPIQPECVDPGAIKRRYGKKLTLHGTISSQVTLPRGTVDQVRDEVLERIRTCGSDGGLVVSPNNVVQPDVPLENLLAMYDTVKSVGAKAFGQVD